MKKLELRDLEVKGKRVLMRVDFNVPMEGREIRDDSRIAAALPSIRYVVEKGGKLILISHLGRPKGKEEGYSLLACAKRLGELLGRDVKWCGECVGEEAERKAKELKEGEVLVLENLRFHKGEEEPEKEPGFIEGLARLADLYVDDAFGSAHRAHASITGVAEKFSGRAASGFLMQKEVKILEGLLQHPKKPFYVMIGGSKISTKAGMIEHLLNLIDGLFVGGAMAYVFLKAKGIKIGDSLGNDQESEIAKKVMEKAKEKKVHVLLPLDLMIADAFCNEAKKKVIRVEDGIDKGWQGMGIGPETMRVWSEELKKAATIFWNGPLSVFEMPAFAQPTFEMAKFLSHLEATVVVGGGDSVAAIQELGLKDKITHISTGGGASLEFLEFGHLPGVDALSNK